VLAIEAAQQVHEERGAERIARSRPVHRVDARRSGACDFHAVFEQDRALGAEGQRGQGRRRAERIELEAIHDHEVRPLQQLGRDGRRGGRVKAEEVRTLAAMTLGDRVAVMRDGRIQQVDTPQRLYRRPANFYVAAFIGSPAMNLVEAEVSDGRVQFAGLSIPLPTNEIRAGRVVLGIRPQDFSLAETADAGLPTIDVEPAIVEELGSATHAIFHIDAPPVDTEAVRAATDEGDSTVLLASDRRALFTAALEEGTPVTVGQALRLAVNPARFHFFDPETSERLDAIGQLV
jgi:hypothetical protein